MEPAGSFVIVSHIFILRIKERYFFINYIIFNYIFYNYLYIQINIYINI